MSKAKELQEKAEMFERRAESATDPISQRHYKEMAAHYRSLAVEHLDVFSGRRDARPLRQAGRPPLQCRSGSPSRGPFLPHKQPLTNSLRNPRITQITANYFFFEPRLAFSALSVSVL